MAGVAPDVTAIPLGRPSPGASSNQPERQGQRIRPRSRPRAASASLLFGLAPGGACRAADVAARAVRSCRTLSPLPMRRTCGRPDGRFAFCGAFPGVAPAGRYPAPHPFGARTFLRFEAAAVRPTGETGIWARRRCGQGESAVAALASPAKDGRPFRTPYGARRAVSDRAYRAAGWRSLLLHPDYGIVGSRQAA